MSFLQGIEKILERKIDDYVNNNGFSPTIILMDDISYFELKVMLYKSEEIASEIEVDEYLGLKVFYNRLGYRYLEVAG